jgi:hypothetical protein
MAAPHLLNIIGNPGNPAACVLQAQNATLIVFEGLGARGVVFSGFTLRGTPTTGSVGLSVAAGAHVTSAANSIIIENFETGVAVERAFLRAPGIRISGALVGVVSTFSSELNVGGAGCVITGQGNSTGTAATASESGLAVVDLCAISDFYYGFQCGRGYISSSYGLSQITVANSGCIMSECSVWVGRVHFPTLVLRLTDAITAATTVYVGIGEQFASIGDAVAMFQDTPLSAPLTIQARTAASFFC